MISWLVVSISAQTSSYHTVHHNYLLRLRPLFATLGDKNHQHYSKAQKPFTYLVTANSRHIHKNIVDIT